MKTQAIPKVILICFSILLLFNVDQVYGQQTLSISVKNTSNQNFRDVLLEIPVAELELPLRQFKIQKGGEDYSPIELVTDIYGRTQALCILSKLAGHSVQHYKVVAGEDTSYPKRTYAELNHKVGGEFLGKEYIGGYSWKNVSSMTLPGSFSDHSYYLKYEGPGWESDQIAYRSYLDNRNAIDVFAKCKNGLFLASIGVENFEDYHHLAPWGMDNLKVGKSLGLGSIAFWNGEKAERVALKDSTTCIVAANGKLRSQVKTVYHGWKVDNAKMDLTSLISIDAGSKLSHVELLTSKPLKNIATGMIKQDKSKFIDGSSSSSEWSYLATFGKQSLNKDNQGLVVFYRTNQLLEVTEDEYSYVVVLQPSEKGYVDYYMMATWELDVESVSTEKEFLECISYELEKLNKNITYQIK